MPTYIGIDISKKTFDACINLKSRPFKNSAIGFAAFVKLIPADAFCVMEATGTYGFALAEHLIAAGFRVAIVNPLQVKRFGQMKLRRQKTDRADAVLITAFADNQQLGPDEQWQPPSDPTNELRQQQTVLEQLKKQRTALLNQLEALSQLPRPSRDAVRAIKKVIASIEKTIKDLEAAQQLRVRQDGDQLFQLVQSVTGIGPTASMALLIATNFFRSCSSARQLASYIGLCPRPYQSGSSIKTPGSIGHSGAPALRALLYVCSISAARYNRACRDLYVRLLAKGKSKKLAHIAVAHKLVRQIFAVVEKRAPFVDRMLKTA
jgi:transposase